MESFTFQYLLDGLILSRISLDLVCADQEDDVEYRLLADLLNILV